MGTLFSGKTSQLGIGCRVYAEWGVVVEGGECDNDKGTLCGSRGGSQHYSSLREVSAERSMGPRAEQLSGISFREHAVPTHGAPIRLLRHLDERRLSLQVI